MNHKEKNQGRATLGYVYEVNQTDVEEMIEIFLKLPNAARERIFYMAEGAALIVEHEQENAAV